MITPDRKSMLVMYKVFAFVISIILVFSVINVLWLISNSEYTIGTVFDLVEEDASIRPVIQFHDINGNKFEFISFVSSSPSQFSVGDHVDVIYDKGNPTNAKINRALNLWVFPMISVVALGWLLTVIFWQSKKLKI